METPIARIARWLHQERNRCDNCQSATSERFCSEACADEWQMLVTV